MTLCVLMAILSVRTIIEDNLYLVITAGILLYSLFVWLFTGVKEIKIFISVTIAYTIMMVIEPISHLAGLKYLNGLDYKIIWFLTGIPHILAIAITNLIIKKVRKSYGKTKSAAH